MSFISRREILFLYTVKDANPNGDPLNENHPRYDEDTEQVLVSDVRIKRTIRDEWVRQGKMVFVDGEPKTLKNRFEELKAQTGKGSGEEVMRECLDTRLFGVTFALGNESFSWTGPVQFKWGRSLHAATFEFIQGTSAFATEGKDGKAKDQRSFRNEYKVPFALIAVYGIANQHAAGFTGAADADLEDLAAALWQGTDNLITRSKNEHKARLYLEIKYRPDFDGKIGALDEKVALCLDDGQELTRDRQKALRRLDEVLVDVSPLVNALKDKQDTIETVRVIKDRELRLKGEEGLQAIGFTNIELR
ncbi:MAG: CRISPR-associated protein Csh2 [Clostridia bacterium]|nr:CRISPR-associated protein Csh2 [Clostridia bacterium]